LSPEHFRSTISSSASNIWSQRYVVPTATTLVPTEAELPGKFVAQQEQIVRIFLEERRQFLGRAILDPHARATSFSGASRGLGEVADIDALGIREEKEGESQAKAPASPPTGHSKVADACAR